ncbi:MAG TPA: pitrilysin family protein [Terricaulis sp.]|nr:pitrilysin family protein [Terricaulis sp.]
MRALLFALAAALALPAQAALAQTREAARPAFQVNVERVVSPGGIEAWLVSDSTVPMIVMRAYWRGGSASEPADRVGVTSVTADMLTEGAGSYDAPAFKRRLEDLNMSLGFSSGLDGVSMSLTTLSENRDAAFEMARLALAEPRFDAAPLERLRRQLMVGIRQRDTNPGYLASLAIDQTLHPDHPYARRMTREYAQALSRAHLQERRANFFARDRMVVTLVGDISAEDARRLLDQTFASVPATTPYTRPADAVLAPATPLILRDLPQPQSLIVFTAPGIQDEDPDWLPLAVANYIIGGGGFSSRLVAEVREKRGLVYGISTAAWVRENAAYLRGSAQTENGNVRQALDVIRAELARIVAEGATQAEVNDAITYLTGSFPLDLDSNVKIANVVQSYQAAGRDIGYINRRNDLIRAVTLADVNRVIARLYAPENFTFVVVGQPAGLEADGTE